MKARTVDFKVTGILLLAGFLVLIFFGFLKTYFEAFLKYFPSISWYIHLHAGLWMLWAVFVFTQG